jgi:hypothetical protein
MQLQSSHPCGRRVAFAPCSCVGAAGWLSFGVCCYPHDLPRFVQLSSCRIGVVCCFAICSISPLQNFLVAGQTLSPILGGNQFACGLNGKVGFLFHAMLAFVALSLQ